jgi:hypothetical protein
MARITELNDLFYPHLFLVRENQISWGDDSAAYTPDGLRAICPECDDFEQALRLLPSWGRKISFRIGNFDWADHPGYKEIFRDEIISHLDIPDNANLSGAWMDGASAISPNGPVLYGEWEVWLNLDSIFSILFSARFWPWDHSLRITSEFHIMEWNEFRGSTRLTGFYCLPDALDHLKRMEKSRSDFDLIIPDWANHRNSEIGP